MQRERCYPSRLESCNALLCSTSLVILQSSSTHRIASARRTSKAGDACMSTYVSEGEAGEEERVPVRVKTVAGVKTCTSGWTRRMSAGLSIINH